MILSLKTVQPKKVIPQEQSARKDRFTGTLFQRANPVIAAGWHNQKNDRRLPLRRARLFLTTNVTSCGSRAYSHIYRAMLLYIREFRIGRHV